MKIGLDYDKTYSEDPTFWNAVINVARSFGHDIRIVTIRDDRFDRTPPICEAEQILPVVYTRGVAKKWYCEHFGEGFVPDVWVDDRPETILANSATTPADLAVWRAERPDNASLHGEGEAA